MIPSRSVGNTQATEEKGMSKRADAAYTRQRSVVACQVCRARKTKCDQRKPKCSFCENVGAECVSVHPGFSAFDPASVMILEHLDALSRKLDSPSRHNGAGPKQSQNLKISISRVPGRCRRSSDFFLSGNLESTSNWIIGSTSSMHNISPELIFCSLSPQHSLPSIDIHTELKPVTCQALLDSFFRNVHIKDPILNEVEVRRLVQKTCAEGLSEDAASCLTLLVCANGAIVRPVSDRSYSQDELEGSLPMMLFNAAQKRIGHAMCTVGIVQAQCHFLAGVFLMAALCPSDAWRFFSQALAQCQQWATETSTHQRDLAESGNAAASNDADVLAKRSLHWSSWKSERELRWELGKEDSIYQAVNHPESFPRLPAECQDKYLQAWYFYLSEISLWRMEISARNDLAQFAANDPKRSFQTVPELSESYLERLKAWRGSLVSSLKISKDGDTAEENFLPHVLSGRETYLYEVITWPYFCTLLDRSQRSSEYATDPQTILWACRGGVFHLKRLLVNKPIFYHRHHGTWLLVRSSARSACLLVTLAQLPLVASTLPSGWRQAVSDTIDMISYWDAGVGAFEATIKLTQDLLDLSSHS